MIDTHGSRCSAWVPFLSLIPACIFLVMAQVTGSLAVTCETWIEFLASDFSLTQHWSSWAFEDWTTGWESSPLSLFLKSINQSINNLNNTVPMNSDFTLSLVVSDIGQDGKGSKDVRSWVALDRRVTTCTCIGRQLCGVLRWEGNLRENQKGQEQQRWNYMAHEGSCTLTEGYGLFWLQVEARSKASSKPC